MSATAGFSDFTGFSDVDASGRSEELGDYLTFIADRMAEIRRQGLEMLNLQAGVAVLDVGCGAGEVCVDLARQVGTHGRVVGVDLSEAMIQKARRSAASSRQGVDFQVASVYRLPFPDQVFDVTRAERLFQHLDDPESALREMVRVTRTSGQIMLLDTEHGQWSVALDETADWRVFEASRHALLRKVVNPHSGVRLRGMMQRAGMKDIKHLTLTLELSYPDFQRAVGLEDLLDASVGDGSVAREEADAFVSRLEARQAAGTFFANSVVYSVTGRRLE
jgi:ubiquinone/menaquinone biosynthesis C-methylase UbiE